MKVKNVILKQGYLKIIGFIVFAYILMNIEIDRVVSILSKSKVSFLVMALIFMVIHIYIKLMRYQFILTLQGIKNPFLKTIRYSLAASYISFITPGRVGEVSKAFFIHNDTGTPLNRLFAGSILNRMFDVYTLLTIALVGFLSVLSVKNNILIIMSILICAMMPSIFLIKNIRQTIVRLIAKTQSKYFNSNNFALSVDQFLLEINALLNWRVIIGIAATVLAYTLFFVSCYFMSLSIGLPLQFHKIVIFIACANILSFFPISFAGIGTREACLVYFFSIEGLSSESALALSTIVFSFTYLFLGLIGFVCLMTLKQAKKAI